MRARRLEPILRKAGDGFECPRQRKEYAAISSRGRPEPYWATDDGVTKASVEFRLWPRDRIQPFWRRRHSVGTASEEILFAHLEEQRYETIAEHRRLLQTHSSFSGVQTRKLQLVIEESKASPTISELKVLQSARGLSSASL